MGYFELTARTCENGYRSGGASRQPGVRVRVAGWLRHLLLQPLPGIRVNGLTPFDDLHGRCFLELLFRFGQPVLVRRPAATLQAKLGPRWIPGLWMGRRALSNEHQVAISRNVILAGRSCRALARDSVDYGVTTLLWQEWCDVRAERPTLKRAVEDEAPQEKRPRPLDAPRSAGIPMGRRLMAKTPLITTRAHSHARLELWFRFANGFWDSFRGAWTQCMGFSGVIGRVRQHTSYVAARARVCEQGLALARGSASHVSSVDDHWAL